MLRAIIKRLLCYAQYAGMSSKIYSASMIHCVGKKDCLYISYKENEKRGIMLTAVTCRRIMNKILINVSRKKMRVDPFAGRHR